MKIAMRSAFVLSLCSVLGSAYAVDREIDCHVAPGAAMMRDSKNQEISGIHVSLVDAHGMATLRYAGHTSKKSSVTRLLPGHEEIFDWNDREYPITQSGTMNAVYLFKQPLSAAGDVVWSLKKFHTRKEGLSVDCQPGEDYLCKLESQVLNSTAMVCKDSAATALPAPSTQPRTEDPYHP